LSSRRHSPAKIETDCGQYPRYIKARNPRGLGPREEGAVPSFDIVSRIDLAEVDNAVAGITREIATRFDFKGSKCTIERKDDALTVLADDDLKLKQMHELLKVHMTRRKVEPGALDYKPPEKASGNAVRQTIALRQGVDANLARQLIREVKDSKLKVQVSIQGDEVRVTGKKRDDLQDAIGVIRGLKIEQPLQYVNFRE
jgi:cyclic-di-GMP-binding protein